MEAMKPPNLDVQPPVNANHNLSVDLLLQFFYLIDFFLLGAATETTTTTKWPVTTHAPVVSKSVIFPDMKTNVNDWRPSRDRYAPRDFDSDANNGRWKTSEGSRTYAGFPHTRSNSISQFPAAKPRCIVFPN